MSAPRKLYSWDRKMLQLTKTFYRHNQIFVQKPKDFLNHPNYYSCINTTQIFLTNQNLVGTTTNFFYYNNQTIFCPNQTVFFSVLLLRPKNNGLQIKFGVKEDMKIRGCVQVWSNISLDYDENERDVFKVKKKWNFCLFFIIFFYGKIRFSRNLKK